MVRQAHVLKGELAIIAWSAAARSVLSAARFSGCRRAPAVGSARSRRGGSRMSGDLDLEQRYLVLPTMNQFLQLQRILVPPG